ncbi:hypothetical protein BU16DRAFT_314558 [Lophium mytilinum]|uniref:Uncharacterized protein n=1 Tax=Lophium mytilinum TaxID=390894 RepID=A0A6A6R230_9PEZI|nr:hypothetical protein BU16DRAFT_314558 [Lophium mytilinum]
MNAVGSNWLYSRKYSGCLKIETNEVGRGVRRFTRLLIHSCIVSLVGIFLSGDGYLLACPDSWTCGIATGNTPIMMMSRGVFPLPPGVLTFFLTY